MSHWSFCFHEDTNADSLCQGWPLGHSFCWFDTILTLEISWTVVEREILADNLYFVSFGSIRSLLWFRGSYHWRMCPHVESCIYIQYTPFLFVCGDKQKRFGSGSRVLKNHRRASVCLAKHVHNRALELFQSTRVQVEANTRIWSCRDWKLGATVALSVSMYIPLYPTR